MPTPRLAAGYALQPRNRAARPRPGRQRGTSTDWFRVENASDSERTIYLHGIVGGGWFDDGISAENLIKEIRDFTGSTLNIRINSPGGDVFEGIAIANTLRSHPADIAIYVDGLAASIASVIAVSGDNVTMMPNAQMMIHNASGGCWGMATDMRKTADILDAITSNIADAYVDRAGGERDQWLALMESETWMNGTEAVERGLADSVATTKNAERTQDDRSAEELADSDAEGEPLDDADSLIGQALQLVPAGMFRFAGRQAAPDPLTPRDIKTVPPTAVPSATPQQIPPPVTAARAPQIDMSAFRAAFKGGR